MALAPVRPYRDYLTPALHRRFNKASRYTLLLCYIIALWMGQWDNFLWLCFPLSLTGIRTLLLFLSAITIYVLRVAQWHVGKRHTETRAETFKKYFFRVSTLVTLFAYSFSAMMFVETYIWSRGPKDRLNFIEAGRMHERYRLNERPLYLRSLFYMLAAAQSAVHLWKDYDTIDVPAMKPEKKHGDATGSGPARRAPKPRHVLPKQFKGMAFQSSFLTVVIAILGGLLYFTLARHVVWGYYYSVGRYLWSLSKTSTPTGIAPFLPLCFMFLTEGTLLVLLWEFVNKTFDIYMAQEPLKNDQPITNDSKDPNGSLLQGLKSKKDTVKARSTAFSRASQPNRLQAIAFWELALITDAFPDRRKTIYSEIDRSKGATFKQATDRCLDEVKFLTHRISTALDPTYNPPAGDGKEQPAVPVNLVPRISQPPKDDTAVTAVAPIPSTGLGHFKAAVAGLANSHSAPGNAQHAYSREAIRQGVKKAQEGAKEVGGLWTKYYNMFVSAPVGALFRYSLARTCNIVVLGAPYSRISLICNAITAVVNLAVLSITEDAFGRYHQCVPEIIRVFTSALLKLDEYMETVPIHWSDKETLEKDEADRRKVAEVEEVRACLREGLKKVLGSFIEYLPNLGMNRLEIMDAKKALSAAKKGPEMIEKGGR
ncbi:Ndc1-Nup domain containing protein [Pyrenophora tritici-repentis]|uniref:Ndc1-Nup domain containing protein n=1 Tax=Pyrenophora tritici-repentis TaxID=45151 RepID=A0A834VPW3_9PLEO|nr:Ndc1-Nup domain containing protein [Pyrenophora tritici-repentis]KAI1517414.1 Nucleoporin protein Ndc1-Nup [Pyrenophora tritici-repentis]KAI1670048.1 Nucleoporin protein Ndc1-Nup [Pyrenophora tritici-repentis]KAI1681646.1 Nucleoporin protein Ndc1-Nup [Pyrenophora tritici-repentis]